MMSDPRCYAPVKQASYVAGQTETSNMPLPCSHPAGRHLASRRVIVTVHRVAKSDALQTNCKRLQGAADARRRVRSRPFVLQVPDNKADAVTCERLHWYWSGRAKRSAGIQKQHEE
jgi:hypothetical protein